MKACPMLIARAHACSSCISLSSCSSQRVGALSLIPSCLGISLHPSGSRSGHPRNTWARSAGRPWVARSQLTTAVQSSIQQSHGAETRQTVFFFVFFFWGCVCVCVFFCFFLGDFFFFGRGGEGCFFLVFFFPVRWRNQGGPDQQVAGGSPVRVVSHILPR